MQLQSHLRASLGLIPCELPCEIQYLHEAQLLQRGSVILCVVGNSEVGQDHAKLHR